jgi:DNA repair protein RecN (Recombination protein N)
MLTTLRIKNLALVADLTLELQPGLNVITGETGAGKSILIGALSLVLGERADRNLVRSGADACSVEAVFDVRKLVTPLPEFLPDNGLEPCEDHQLVLKRSFTITGANRQFINGSPTTLAVLAKLGEWLVDIHGPHEHQSLLHTARQLDILDAFGGLHPQREQFARLVQKHAALRHDKSALIVDDKTYARQLDLLRFQAHEIESARLVKSEDVEIDAEHRRASNAARLLELTQTALEAISGAENSLTAQSALLGRSLQELQRIDPAAASLSQIHSQLLDSLRELESELSHYAEKVEVDPARLQQVEERLNLLQSLKRKYGSSLAEVIAFGEEARQKLSALEQRDVELDRINASLKQVETQLRDVGTALSAQRRKLIPTLSKAVGRELKALGFAQSHFDVLLASDTDSTIASGQFSTSGFDKIEFQFAPNPGEPPRPLRAIASSGEMARVMLALKTVLASVDQIPVLVFDEVDANIGGEIAHAVGEKMEQIGRSRQVLCITHLPQVAAHGSAHFVVAKQVKSGRTFSEITLLAKNDRVTELARMLGGLSEAATRHAEALIHQATKRND